MAASATRTCSEWSPAGFPWVGGVLGHTEAPEDGHVGRECGRLYPVTVNDTREVARGSGRFWARPRGHLRGEDDEKDEGPRQRTPSGSCHVARSASVGVSPAARAAG